MHVLTLIFILFIFKYYIFFLLVFLVIFLFFVFVCFFVCLLGLFLFGWFFREAWFCISLCSTEQPYTSNMRTFSIHYLRALGPFQRKSPFINYHVTLYKFTKDIRARFCNLINNRLQLINASTIWIC